MVLDCGVAEYEVFGIMHRSALVSFGKQAVIFSVVCNKCVWLV